MIFFLFIAEKFIKKIIFSFDDKKYEREIFIERIAILVYSESFENSKSLFVYNEKIIAHTYIAVIIYYIYYVYIHTNTHTYIYIYICGVCSYLSI